MTTNDTIQNLITTHDVVVFMKGTQDFPMCGFSGAVAQIMGHLQVQYHDVNVLDDEDIRQGIKDFSNWPTIPQVYIKGEFVGGCDIIREMFETGELQDYLTEKGIQFGG